MTIHHSDLLREHSSPNTIEQLLPAFVKLSEFQSNNKENLYLY